MKWYILLPCLCSLGLAAKHSSETLEVKVVSNDTRAIRYKNNSLIGVMAGSRTEQVVFGLNVIIDDKHVRLVCTENHKGCPSFETGHTFSGEFDGKDSIWMIQTVPVSNKVIRAHFKITGGW